MTTLSPPTARDLPRVKTAEQASEMLGDHVAWREPNLHEPTVALDADTGQAAFAYLPIGNVATLRRAVLSFHFDRETSRANGMRNRSRVFGYSPRRPVYKRDGCSATKLPGESPDAHQTLIDYGNHLQKVINQLFPAVGEHDAEVMTAVNPDWKLGETNWTSGVVNQSSSLPYHRDGFNFECWTAMPVLRRHMSGGYLHLPEYDVTVPSRDGWAVFFPGYDLVHGVTPMKQLKPGGYRYSIVYYALRGMKDCFTHAVEQGYAKRKRTEREQRMADDLRTGTVRDQP